MKKYTLGNGVEMNKLHPTTFFIPTIEEKKNIKVGDFVKMIFNYEELISERMWVRVTQVNGDNFIGELDNIPFEIPMECGDIVEFKGENIISIY